MKNRQWIFGYGSLINSESRALTVGKKNAVPLTINGFSRSWAHRVEKYRRTDFNVSIKKNSKINGIAFEVSSDELKKIDEREKAYSRIKAESSKINGNLWTYTLKEQPMLPTKKYPIALSYADCCIAGCLEIGKKFAEEFIETTDDGIIR